MLKGQIWRARAFGDPEAVLRLEEQSFPPPQSGRLLVRVAAVGIGLPDFLLIGGKFPGVTAPPITPGQEVVGEIVEVAEASSFRPGDRVMGLTPFMEGAGGCGQYSYVVEAKAIQAPVFLTDEAAAGFLIGFRTAYAALVNRTPVRPGQTVLILGAAGSSGAAAIQLALALGARVVAIAGGPAKCDFCRKIGAEIAIDYKATTDLRKAIYDAAPAGVDVVFDPVGGLTAEAAVSAIARNGRVALIGYASGGWLKPDPLDMVLRNYDVCGVFAGGYSIIEDQAAYRHLLDLASQKQISTPLGMVSPFKDVPAAISTLRNPFPGKSVITLAGH